MTKKYIILGAIAFSAVLGFGIYVLFVAPNKKNAVSQKTSPDILFLTYPINTFTGIIEKIEGNTLFVSKDAPFQETLAAKPVYKTLLYKVTITSDTVISEAPNTIPYLYKENSPNQNKTPLGITDLKAGQFITANTTTDLRTLQSDTFETKNIKRSTNPYPLIGKITEISGNTITITGRITRTQSASSEPIKEESYTVAVSSDTEISQPAFVDPNNPNKTISEAKKLSVSSLSTGMVVSVYSDTQLLPNQDNTALLIQQITSPILPVTPVTILPSTPSATTEE